MDFKRRELLKTAAVFGTAFLLGGCAAQQKPTPSSSERYSVYLTTDDGPMRCSGSINEVILEEKVPMEAFIVGKHARSKLYRSYLEAYRSNPYVTLANHSYSHANGHYLAYYNHPQKILDEFEKTRSWLHLPGKVGRLPGRDSWRLGGRRYDADKSARRAADLLAAHGWRLYGWDLEWTHTHSGKPIDSAESLYRKIKYRLEHGKTFTKGHLIVLLHDQMFGTPQARGQLKRLIELLKSDPEIRLRPLSDYPLSGAPRKRVKSAPRLVPAPSTGVGETTPVDPLKFAH